MLIATVFFGGTACRGRHRRTTGGTPNAAGLTGGPEKTSSAAKPPLEAASLPLPEELPAPPPGHTGGTLRVHLDAEPAHLHPLNDPDPGALLVTTGLVYQTLLRCEGGQYRPSLAESWETSTDGLRITLHLRGGVRWHDHHGFGVLDVQATLEPLLRNSPTMPLVRSDLADVATIEIAADRIVRLNLKRPSDLALRALCDVPILPSHLIRDVRPDAAPIARQPIGTGPYRFVAWEKGKRIRLARAPEPWDAPGAPEEIVFEIDTDAIRALNRTRRGDLDILPRVLDVHYPDQVEPSTLHDTTALYRVTPDRYSFLVANTRHFPLGDARFRRGLAMLWDRERFAHELHRDLARPIGGPTFGVAASAPVPLPYDRARAIAMLNDAGYRDTDADGVRDQNQQPIRLTLLQTTGARALALEARAFALEARKAGILIDVVNADGPTILARLKRGEFDLAPMMWEGRADEDPVPLFGATGAFNFGAYRSTALDGLLDALHQAAGPEARRPVLTQIAALLAADQPVIFLYRHDVPLLVSRRVHGLGAVGDRLDLRRVWLDP
ncbi:MAG TPA: ABC transporter substrate-binding protein [Polyangia bacterium]|nr:ABC transporter substrate-binding protein [Polyangia bacterium]